MPHHLTLQSQITLPEPRWSSPSPKTTSLKVSNVGSSPSLICDSLLSISNATSSQPSFIDTNVLKESCLGRVVLFYTKCRRFTPDIGRQADHLVSVWSRPIIKRSASHRDRIIPNRCRGWNTQEEPREAERDSCKGEGVQQAQGSEERGHNSSVGVGQLHPSRRRALIWTLRGGGMQALRTLTKGSTG